MFLISQSLLDCLCAIFLIATAWDVTYVRTGGHFGTKGKKKSVYYKFAGTPLRSLLSLTLKSPTDTKEVIHIYFFGANQGKADIKIFSWTQCEINKVRHDWHIWADNEERIA